MWDRRMCVFFCAFFFVCVCVCVCWGGDFFWYTEDVFGIYIQYFQCFTEGFLTQGIVSLIFHGILDGQFKEFLPEGVRWMDCHWILSEDSWKNRSSNNHQTSSSDNIQWNCWVLDEVTWWLHSLKLTKSPLKIGYTKRKLSIFRCYIS